MYENKRIKFVDSEGEDEAMHCLADDPHTIPNPAEEITKFHLLGTVNTDFNQSDQCYVLQLASNPTSSHVAAALSNKHIKLFSLRECSLQFTGTLDGHTSMITDIETSIPEDPYIVFSSSHDKTVKAWDLRAPQRPTESYTIPKVEASCCSSNGNLLAAGGRDNIYFWDRRARKPLLAFTDTHATDVTQVKFHPQHRSAFISGSEDGFIAVFDTSHSSINGIDEDEGFRAALNIDTAVAKIGFYKDRLWCCSGTETLHLWEWAAACNDEVEGGNGALGNGHDAREQAYIDAGHPRADYLLQCEYDDRSDQLAMAVGTIDGTVAMFRVGDHAAGTIGNAIKLGKPMAVLQGGHCDIVRSMVCVGREVWLTGAEDGRICVWRGAALSEKDISSGGPISRQQGHMRRASPY